MPNVQVGPTKDEKNLIEDGTPNLSSYRVYPYPNKMNQFLV